MIKKILVLSLIIILIFSNIFTIYLYFNEKQKSDIELIENYGDEISRVKFFIVDWYDEISQSYSRFERYYNELRFENGLYTLTIMADRIRAVFPRGIRFFQLNYVTYLEFIDKDGFLQCRIYYGDSGEYIFKIK